MSLLTRKGASLPLLRSTVLKSGRLALVHVLTFGRFRAAFILTGSLIFTRFHGLRSNSFIPRGWAPLGPDRIRGVSAKEHPTRPHLMPFNGAIRLDDGLVENLLVAENWRIHGREMADDNRSRQRRTVVGEVRVGDDGHSGSAAGLGPGGNGSSGVTDSGGVSVVLYAKVSSAETCP